MNSSNLSYRAEIDGLRAIAVISVILYHAQIVSFDRNWFEGGFIGVDIFFVISGYLITRIILSELQIEGSLSFLSFYERRARRILPMLLVVIFASMPFAWQLMLPSEFVEYAESILASQFFISNIFFYFNTTEYGADSALLKPFLHTWSLGIEEQFYLIFPILAMLVFKFFRAHFLTILVVLSLLSLQFASLMEVQSPNLNFYLPFSRFWELGVGSILAYRELNYKFSDDGVHKRVLPTLGLCMVAYSILFFTGETPHPSFHTLIPIFGVALIIRFSSKDEPVGKILGGKLLVYVGLISYSAYLWHFPVLAFARVNSSEPNSYEKFQLLLVILLLSVLSYWFIEKPTRDLRYISRRLFFLLLSTSSFIVILLVSVASHSEGFPGRYPNGWKNFELDDKILRQGFWKYFEQNKEQLLKPSDQKINVYIFGNSHATDFLSALFIQIDAYDKYHFLKASKQEQLSCFDESDSRFGEQKIALYESNAYKKSDIFVIATRFIDAKCDVKLKDNPSDADGLKFLIPNLKKENKKVLILGNTLVLNRVDGKWLEEKIYIDAVREKIDFHSINIFKRYKEMAEKEAYKIQSELNIETNARLKVFSKKNHLAYFDRRQLFCDSILERCSVFTKDGSRLRYDYGHLTLHGKKEFGRMLQAASFESILYDVWKNQKMIASPFVPY